MRKKSEYLNRRSFLRTTGTALTGFTLIPLDLIGEMVKLIQVILSIVLMTSDTITGEKWWKRSH